MKPARGLRQPKPEPLTREERYREVAEHIEREQALIHNRMSWMLTFEGFLFAGLALVSDTRNTQEVRDVLKDVLPLIGVAVALFTLIGVVGAYVSINRAKKNWNDHAAADDPPAFGTTIASLFGRVPSFGVPLTVAAAWVYVILVLD